MHGTFVAACHSVVAVLGNNLALRWRTSFTAIIAGLVLATVAQAQSGPPSRTEAQADADVEQAIENERDLTAVTEPRADCPVSPTGEIVVCARNHSDRYRIPSTSAENPNSPEALRTGALHPPDVYSHPSDGVKIGFGHVPPPIYYIDTTKLPMPPPGSDADKIAKGEMAAP
jgi:hypothetical protein